MQFATYVKHWTSYLSSFYLIPFLCFDTAHPWQYVSTCTPKKLSVSQSVGRVTIPVAPGKFRFWLPNSVLITLWFQCGALFSNTYTYICTHSLDSCHTSLPKNVKNEINEGLNFFLLCGVKAWHIQKFTVMQNSRQPWYQQIKCPNFSDGSLVMVQALCLQECWCDPPETHKSLLLTVFSS